MRSKRTTTNLQTPPPLWLQIPHPKSHGRWTRVRLFRASIPMAPHRVKGGRLQALTTRCLKIPNSTKDRWNTISDHLQRLLCNPWQHLLLVNMACSQAESARECPSLCLAKRSYQLRVSTQSHQHRSNSMTITCLVERTALNAREQ